MPKFSTGTQWFTRKDGTKYSKPSKDFTADSTHEAMQYRKEYIEREKSRGNHWDGGGSLERKG